MDFKIIILAVFSDSSSWFDIWLTRKVLWRCKEYCTSIGQRCIVVFFILLGFSTVNNNNSANLGCTEFWKPLYYGI